jgi:hypothetical protein
MRFQGRGRRWQKVDGYSNNQRSNGSYTHRDPRRNIANPSHGSARPAGKRESC